MVIETGWLACAPFREPTSTAVEAEPADAVDAPSIPRIAVAIHVLLKVTLIGDSSIAVV
jgi:hypothetical protein